MANLVIERVWTYEEDANFLFSVDRYVNRLTSIIDQLELEIAIIRQPIHVCTCTSASIAGYMVRIELDDEVYYNAIKIML